MSVPRFEVASEVTGEHYQVEFHWLQTAISLRHSDTVDVKFFVNGAGRIVALPHGALEQACRESGLRLTDELCQRLAARHLHEALRTGTDAEKDLLTLTPARVEDLVRAEAHPDRSQAAPASASSSSGGAVTGSRSSASSTLRQSRHST